MGMILASTNYDPETSALEGYVLELANVASVLVHLSGAHIHHIDHHIEAELKNHPHPRLKWFCFFGHGSKDHPHHPLDQSECQQAISNGAAELLDQEGITVYGCFCFSALNLTYLCKADAIGFADEVLFPTEYPDYAQETARCLLAVPRSLLAGDTPQAAVTAMMTRFDDHIARLTDLDNFNFSDQAFATNVALPNRRAIRLQ